MFAKSVSIRAPSVAANPSRNRRLAVSPSAVGKWRRRFVERGVQGLHDELRPGRPRTYDDEKVAVLINRASASPFVWVATAESIFGKLERLSARICGT